MGHFGHIGLFDHFWSFLVIFGHGGSFTGKNGRKINQNWTFGSFSRHEVWPTDQILAKKKSGPQKFKSSQKKLIPAQLGKFLGSKVGPFWPSDCLRGPPRKSKMQKIFQLNPA